MIKFLTLVLILSVIGDAIAASLDAPVPGSAIGLLLLTSLFVVRNGPDAGAVRLFEAVAPHFPLFFIPAAVGVVASTEVLSQTWLFFVAAIVFSTTVTIAVTGRLAQVLLERLKRSRASHHGCVHVERLA